MNNKAFTISLMLALGAAFMVWSYITSTEENFKKKYGDETAVVIAKDKIDELEEITGNKIEIISKPKRYIEPGHTNTKEEVEGFIAAVPIRKGEQITLNKIIAPGVRTGLSRVVTPGKRAVAIQVGEVNAVSKLLKPGDRIDLTVTIDAGGAQKGAQVTKVFLQDIPILAVGEYITTTAPRKLERDDTTNKTLVRNLAIDRSFNTITLELNADEALQIIHMQNTGSFMSIMLRNSDDTERLQISGTNTADVLGSDAQKIRGIATQR